MKLFSSTLFLLFTLFVFTVNSFSFASAFAKAEKMNLLNSTNKQNNKKILRASKLFGTVSTSHNFKRIEGNIANSQLDEVSNAGDVNGDGYDDVVIGYPKYDSQTTDCGAVKVFYGGAQGVDFQNPVLLIGNNEKAQFGGKVSAAGDLNHDGFDDIMIMEKTDANFKTVVFSYPGSISIYFGSASGITENNKIEIKKTNHENFVGFDELGDVNHDGWDDIGFVCEELNADQSTNHYVEVFYGSADLKTGATLSSTVFKYSFGPDAKDVVLEDYQVFGLKDVNQDGYFDWAVSINALNSQKVIVQKIMVFHGGSGSQITQPQTTLYNDEQNSLTLLNAGEIGDVNADGYADLMIASLGFDFSATSGYARIYYGSQEGIKTLNYVTVTPEDNRFSLGAFIGAAGDVNQDGYGDFYCTGANENTQVTYIFHGSSGVFDHKANTIIDPFYTLDGTAKSISYAGDLDSDGYADLIESNKDYSNGAGIEGAATIYYGRFHQTALKSLIGQQICEGHIFNKLKYKPQFAPTDFQWYKGKERFGKGELLTAAITENFQPEILAGDSLYYLCELTTDYGVVYRSPWSDLLSLKPITRFVAGNLEGGRYCKGSNSKQLKVDFRGVNLRYQWYKNTIASNLGGDQISGANTSVYQPETHESGIFYFYCEVIGDCGAAISPISQAVEVGSELNAVYVAPWEFENFCEGGKPTNLVASSVQPVNSYQWYHSMIEDNASGSVLVGQNSVQLDFSTINAPKGYYYCKIEGSCGTMFTPLVGKFPNNKAPQVIHVRMREQTVCVGVQPELLAITAIGYNLTYQWYRNSSQVNQNGELLPGKVYSELDLSGSSEGKFYYYCVVKNECGEISSRISELVEIRSKPKIISESLSGQSSCKMQFQPISVVGDSPGINYEWFSSNSADGSNGNIVSYGVDRITIVPDLGSSSVRYFYCNLKNECGETQSSLSGQFSAFGSKNDLNQLRRNVESLNVGTMCPNPNDDQYYLEVYTDDPSLKFQWYLLTSFTGKRKVIGAISKRFNPLHGQAMIGVYSVVVKSDCDSIEFTGGYTNIKEKTRFISEPQSVIKRGAQKLPQSYRPVVKGERLSYEWYEWQHPFSQEALTDQVAFERETDDVLYKRSFPPVLSRFLEFAPETDRATDKMYYLIVRGECGDVRSKQLWFHAVDNVVAEVTDKNGEQGKCRNEPFDTLFINVIKGQDIFIKYQWYKYTCVNSHCDNSTFEVIPGATENFYVPKENEVGFYQYTCAVYNSSCWSTSLEAYQTSTRSKVKTVISPIINEVSYSLVGKKYCPDDYLAQYQIQMQYSVKESNVKFQWFRNTQPQNFGGTPVTEKIAGDWAYSGAYTSFIKYPSTPGVYYYYCVASNACSSKTSPISGKIEVLETNPLLNAASNVNQVICNNGTSTPFEVTPIENVSRYVWMVKKSGSNSYSAVYGVSGKSYTPPMPENHEWVYYTCHGVTNCGVTTTVNFSLRWNEVSNLSVITNASLVGDHEVCMSSSATSLKLESSTSEDFANVRWYRSVSPSVGTGSEIASQSGSSFVPQTNEQGSFYYYAKISVGCNSWFSTIAGPLKIGKVLTASLNSIEGQTVCLNSVPKSLVVTITSGEATQIRWYKKYENNNQPELVHTSLQMTFVPETNQVGTFYYYCEVENDCHTIVKSEEVKIEVINKTPIQIVENSLPNLILCNGAPIHGVSVKASGANVAYQWYYKENSASDPTEHLISGATNESLTFNPLGDQTYFFYCKVSDNCDNYTSPFAKIEFTSTFNVSFTSNGQQTLCKGGLSDQLTISANQHELSYQWYEFADRELALTNQTTSVFLPPSAVVGKKDYFCKVTNQCGETRKTIFATVDVRDKPRAINPVVRDQKICFSKPAVPLQVTSVEEDIDFQWFECTSLSKQNAILIPQQRAISFVPPTNNSLGKHFYFCVLKNDCGTDTSAVFTVDYLQDIAFTSNQLTNASYCQNGEANELVVAASGIEITYQWFKMTEMLGVEVPEPLSGQNTDRYKPATNVGGQTKYFCKIQDGCGNTLQSSIATITVLPSAEITKQPLGVKKFCVGVSNEFVNVEATGENVGYQWYKSISASTQNGDLIQGANQSRLTFSNLPVGVHYFYCEISSDCGGVLVSEISKIEVMEQTVMVNAPVVAHEICKHSVPVLLNVQCNGTNLSYRWYKNNVASYDGASEISASGSSIEIAADLAGTKYFYCKVEGTCGNVLTELIKAVEIPETKLVSELLGAQTVKTSVVFQPLKVEATGRSLTYQWFTNTIESQQSAEEVLSANSSVYQPICSDWLPHYYYCKISGSCGTIYSSLSGEQICVDDASIAEYSQTQAFYRIYPNPTNQIVNLEMFAGSVTFKLRLLDLNGKELPVICSQAGELLAIDFGVIGKGVYLLELSEEKTGVIHKERVVVN